MPVPDVWPKDIFKSFKIMPTKHLSNAFKNLSKIAKGTWKAMGTAAKEIKTATSLFAAFGSESLITKVFNKVIGNYTKYLSDTFWGEVVKEIDFDVMTTAITDILGPIFAGIGTWIADRIAEAPVGASIGGALGGLIGSAYGPMGQLVGTLAGMAIGWLADKIADRVAETTEPPPGAPASIPYGEPGSIPQDYASESYYNWYQKWAAQMASYGETLPLPTWIPPPTAAEYFAGLTPQQERYERYERYSLLGQYQFGTPYVPKSGPYHLTRGEAVVSAKENRQGSGGININIDLRNAVVDNVDRLSQKIAEQVMIRIG